MDTITTLIVDTTEFIRKAEVTEFYKEIASKQATQFTIMISVLAGLTALIIGVTLFWNFYAAKKQIKEEIDSEKKILNEKFKELEKEIQEKLVIKVNEGTEEVNRQLEEILSLQKNELKDFKSKIEKSIDEQQANISRVFALHCESTETFFHAYTWWLDALEFYNKIDDQEFIGLSTNAILDNLNKSENEDFVDYNFENGIKQIEEFVPKCKTEKKQIVKKLKEFKKSQE